MGHLGHLKEEYRALVHRLEASQVSLPEPTDPRAWAGWREVLEILYTPEEAALAARLPVKPTSLERLEARLGIPAAELKRRLDPMCDKGVVMDLIHPDTGQVKYLLSPPVVGFFEFSMMRAHDSIPKKRMAEAIEAYFEGDEAWVQEVFGGETGIGRALAHETALDDDFPEVLDWERATGLLEQASARAVSLCFCRHKAEHLGKNCSATLENCLSLNGGAEYVIRRGFGRAIEKSEALEILARSREEGLVQIADNVMSRPIYICNCCGCCCDQLRAINHFGVAAVNPSGFVPTWDVASCKGCLRCARACPITSISMTAERVETQAKNRLVPVIDADRCIGCGVCVDACRNQAMRMARRDPRPAVPESGLERAIRMSLERGHLGRLVFDEGAGRGNRFLGRVVGLLGKLPPAKQALANEQLRSRFVAFVLKKVKGSAPHELRGQG